MPDVSVTVAGKDYKLSCAPGEEERLSMLAALVDNRANNIKTKLRHASDTRLMLMTAILIADELAELQESTVTEEIEAAADKNRIERDGKIARLLHHYADKAETITKRLQKSD